MTRITYIHAIPADEIRDRGAAVTKSQRYLNYTNMTEGEMKLALLQEQARMLSQAYPEMAYLKTASAMLDNALYKGVHGGIQFHGIVDPALYDVARSITNARGQSRPAGGTFLNERNIFASAGIGDSIVPVTTEDCEDYATRMANKKYGLDRKKFWWKALPFGGKKGHWKQFEAECKTKKDIEGILNRAITGSSHHVVYKSLDVLKPVLRNTFVRTKNLLHLAGVQGLGNAADVNKTLMNQWVETALMQANAGYGFGPVDSVVTSLSIAPDPGATANAYFSGNTSEKQEKIGLVVATITAVTALVAAIGAAVGKAAEMQKELNAKKNGVMAAANGFGTEAFRAETSDYDTDGQPHEANKTMIYLGGAAVLGWLLLKK